MRARYRVRVHAYGLMPNHYHLLVRTPEGNISAALQWLNGSYAMWYNRRHGCSGHLFGERFKAILVEDGAWVLELSLYIHLNPVATEALGLGKRVRAVQRQGIAPPPTAAEVTRRLERLRRFRWSSYPAYAEYGPAVAWLDSAEVLARAGGAAGYRQRMEERIRQGEAADWRQNVRWGLVLGSERFARRVRSRIRVDRELAGRGELARRRPFEEIVAQVERLKREPWGAFRDRYGDWGRDLVLWAARRYSGLRLRELGAAAGGMDYTAVANAIRRLPARATTDRQLRKAMTHLQRECIK
jgi:hypothetical protein